MDKRQEVNSQDYYTIDLIHILRTMWRGVWLIILAGIVAGALGFALSAFVIKPTYSSSIKLYVNNSSFSLGNTTFSISSSELTAAQSLVKTYGDILDSRSTLERIIDKAGVEYTYEELSKKIEYSSSNGTEIMKVTVTTTNPYESAKIANTIAEILPIRISEIIDGASMEVVDSAIPELEKVAPSITKYTAVGLILGILVALIILIIVAMRDDTIHDEDYILNNYKYPILGKVPDLTNAGNKKRYGYYYSHYRAKQSETEEGDNA